MRVELSFEWDDSRWFCEWTGRRGLLEGNGRLRWVGYERKLMWGFEALLLMP